MKTKSCSSPCRFGHNVSGGWYCRLHNINHGTEQFNCKEYVGEMTLFEYFMATQPQELYDLLKGMKLKIVDARNQYGFNIVRDE